MSKKYIKWNIELIKLWTVENRTGYICKSTDYKDNRTKMLWECPEGHEFKIELHSFKDNSRGCPFCSHNLKHTINEVDELCHSIGYTCKDRIYKSNSTKMIFECDKHHEYKSTFKVLKKGHRCPECCFINRRGELSPKWKKDRSYMTIIQQYQKKANKYKENFRKTHNIPRHSGLEVDHIFPIYAFIINDIFNESIINNDDNLQLITRKENRSKGNKYNKSKFEEYLLKFCIILENVK